MALDLEQLLAPVSEEAPAGPDLAYDPERQEIEQAFDSAVSADDEQAGDTDWRRIISLIEGQSSRTKDIWLAVYLCRAAARAGRLDQVELGAQYLAGLVERYWEVVHPQLEEYAFQGRKGACEALTRLKEFLGPVQRTTLLEHPRLGRFSGVDFERFSNGGEGEDGYGVFRAAVQDVGDAELQAAADRIAGIIEALRRADRVLTANADGDTAPNFAQAYETLDKMRRSVLAFVTVPAEPEAAPEEVDAPAAAGAPSAPAAPRIAGQVESRDDVVRAIDAISDYYRRKEPTSPVPLLLRRAKEWVTLDFLKIMEDLAPAGLDEARRVLASRNENG